LTNNSKPSINLQQWEMWLSDPVTKQMQEWAKERREELKENWELAQARPTQEQVLEDTFSRGAMSVLRELENPTPETILNVSFSTPSQNDGTPEN